MITTNLSAQVTSVAFSAYNCLYPCEKKNNLKIEIENVYSCFALTLCYSLENNLFTLTMGF